MLDPGDPAGYGDGAPIKWENGLPPQVHVLREDGAVHVSEAEPGTTGTGQHDGPVSGHFRFSLLLFFYLRGPPPVPYPIAALRTSNRLVLAPHLIPHRIPSSVQGSSRWIQEVHRGVENWV